MLNTVVRFYVPPFSRILLRKKNKRKKKQNKTKQTAVQLKEVTNSYVKIELNNNTKSSMWPFAIVLYGGAANQEVYFPVLVS